MINFFLQLASKNFKSETISIQDIHKSKKILFALFTRYGDTIINLVIIREFIEIFPGKDYMVLCPIQMQPYVEEILPNIKVISVNKRNFFQMLYANKVLKKWKPDIGFNPWSNGLDSCFFISYSKKYQCYREFKFKNPINHYEVVRNYLKTPTKKFFLTKDKPKSAYKKILICPESTDWNRSMSLNELNLLIEKIRATYSADLTIAAISSVFKSRNSNINFFQFSKSRESSKNFIGIIKSHDLVFTVDSAPLHLSIALNIDTFPIFKSTSEALVLNTNSKVIYDF